MGGPWQPAGVKGGAHRIRRWEEGWVAWDGYPERDPYRTSCSLPEGSGRFSVLKAMDSSGVRVLRVPDNAPGFGGDSLISAGERRNISAQEHR